MIGSTHLLQEDYIGGVGNLFNSQVVASGLDNLQDLSSLQGQHDQTKGIYLYFLKSITEKGGNYASVLSSQPFCRDFILLWWFFFFCME